MRRVGAFVVVTASVAVVAVLATQTRAASGKSSASIPVLNVGLLGSVSNLDPSRAIGGANNYLWFTYDGLMKIDKDGALHPWLAKQVKHPNPNTWIYVLRKGVKFWDGDEMTSADVANALNYYRFPKSQTAFLFRSVRNVTAVDRYTVKVDLKHPDATWKYTPAFMSFIFEKRYADAHSGQWGKPGTPPMATGPWKVASLADPTRGAEFLANDKYWGGRPSIRRISIKFFSDETSEALAMRSGDIDVAFPNNSKAFAATSGAKVSRQSTCALGLLSMNTNVAPWNDVHVRRAVAYAVNRAGIGNALGGDVTPEQFIIPKQMWGATGVKATELNKLYKSLPTYSYDLGKARRELAQSKYPNGFSASTVTTSGVGAAAAAAQVISADLAKIGIKLDIKNVPFAQWVAYFFGPRSDIGIFMTGSGCATPDPSWYSGTFLSSANARTGSTNIADYKSSRIDALLKAGQTADTPSKRLAAYAAVLKAVQTDVPYVAYYTVNRSTALSNKVTWPSVHQYSIGTGSPWPLDIKSK